MTQPFISSHGGQCCGFSEPTYPDLYLGEWGRPVLTGRRSVGRRPLRSGKYHAGWRGQQRSGERLRLYGSAPLHARFRAGVPRNHRRLWGRQRRSSGSQVSVVTKSGANQFQGSLYEYNRSSLGEANDWFNKQAELSNGLPDMPGKLIRNTFGASLGGPIQKDKAFFFVNYEGQRTEENQQETITVPTVSMRSGNIQYLATGNSRSRSALRRLRQWTRTAWEMAHVRGGRAWTRTCSRY